MGVKDRGRGGYGAHSHPAPPPPPRPGAPRWWAATRGGAPDTAKVGETASPSAPAAPAVFAIRFTPPPPRPDLAAALTAGTLASARGRSWRAATMSVVDSYREAAWRSHLRRGSVLPAGCELPVDAA